MFVGGCQGMLAKVFHLLELRMSEKGGGKGGEGGFLVFLSFHGVIIR